MKTTAVVFPFDLFGSGGAAAGAQLLADELREVLADNRRETVPTRAAAYSPHVKLREVTFARLDDYAGWREQGRRLAAAALRRGDYLLWLAGNHLGALPVYDELSALGQGVLVVQLDAHLDVHHFRDTTKEPSHGNFLLHCAGPLPAVVNVGHRDLLLPREYVGRFYRKTFSAAELAVDAGAVLGELRELAGRAERVYLDLDCDVFDPAYFPAVGEPVPFGVSPAEVVRVVEAVGPGRLAGALVSELDPGRDVGDRSLAAAVWLVEYLLLRRYEG
jgi:arginase family enzyme